MVVSSIDLERPWALDSQVALRPERFGALAYNFATRRLSFLKSKALVSVVEGLEHHDSARAACVAAGVGAEELSRYAQALATLARGGMIRPREEQESR
jgi:mycofactocin biosynthesis protein MftB